MDRVACETRRVKWASAISRRTSFGEAVSECVEDVARTLGPGEVSLALAFVTPHFAARYSGGELYERIASTLAPSVFAGCSGGGVIGGKEEIESLPAVALVAASLPGVTLTPFRFDRELPDLDGPPDAWRDVVGVEPDDLRGVLLLSDPFSSRAQSLVSGLDYAYPGSPKVGGLASGGTSPGTNSLFLDGEVLSAGSVGVALSGEVVMETIVAQGCRPVGDLMTVTACDGNMLLGLDDRSALESAREMFSTLEDRDAGLARNALFIGVLMDEFSEKPGAGEFLIRNLIGVEPEREAIAIGESLQQGMRLRFHVRDAETSAEDLHRLLAAHAEGSPPSSGAVLFSCLGRGQNLYGSPNFDTGLFRDLLGDVPVGGFFCNGEIGPVGGTTFLHGYTSSFAMFRPTTRLP